MDHTFASQRLRFDSLQHAGGPQDLLEARTVLRFAMPPCEPHLQSKTSNGPWQQQSMPGHACGHSTSCRTWVTVFWGQRPLALCCPADALVQSVAINKKRGSGP